MLQAIVTFEPSFIYLFGAFLIFIGIKRWIIADHLPDIANNPLLKFLKRHMRVTDGLHGNTFWVSETDPATGRLDRFSLGVTFGLIAGGVLVSLWKTRGQPALVEPT